MVNPNSSALATVLWYYRLLPMPTPATFKIVCPFHHDMNPSMLVNLAEGNWYCFGCNRSGNAFEFVRQMEPEANTLQLYSKILKSGKQSNFRPPSVSTVQMRTHTSKQLYAEAYDYYHGLRKVDWNNDSGEEIDQARQYMLDRGFSPSTLNLVGAKVTYNTSYGIIFPITDNGKFRGWVCRTMIPEIAKKRKYLYNKGFTRATTLVGNYGSKRYVVVVEGYMDRLKFIQCGYTNVVAIFGWRITNEQIQKLRDSNIQLVISALDNDECGRNGTKYLRQFFSVVRFQYLKGLKDPGDMDMNKFRKMINKTSAKAKAEYNVDIWR